MRALAALELPHLDRVRELAPPAGDATGLPGRWVTSGEAAAFAVPGLVAAEPAYGQAVDWMLCAALADLERPGRGVYYFRLTTRPLDQAPFEGARERLGDALLRRQVLTGAYRLRAGGAARRRAVPRPAVQIAAVGPTVVPALAGAERLEAEGVSAHVVEVTSADTVYAAWQRAVWVAVRTAGTPALVGVLRQAFDLDVPLVTLHDQSPHPLAWLGSALGVPAVPVPEGVAGDADRAADAVVNAALAALGL